MNALRLLTPALVTGFALLSSCAQLDWHKAGASLEMREHDSADCAVQARSAALRRAPLLPSPVPQVLIDRQGRAAQLQPSRAVDERFLIEQDVMRTCMRERGYSLIERPTPTP